MIGFYEREAMMIESQGRAVKGGSMKRAVVFTLLLLFLCFTSKAYALDFKVFEMRNKIFEESKELRTLLPNSRDAILTSSMFDSCIIIMSQLDAYFSMLGIFDSISKEDLNDKPLDLLENWIKEIKNTSETNINSLNNVSETLDAKTKIHLDKLKGYFSELSKRLDPELSKVSVIRKSLKVKKPAGAKK